MDYHEAYQWLQGFERFGSHYGLERITLLAEKLGNPQHHLRVIHVTGTNGKGSVCTFIGSILQCAGYHVGVYLSPHLQQFSERIRIDTQQISENDFVTLVEQIKPIIDDMIQQHITPTFFEIVTAMAFVFFHDKHVDFAVIEVGLGGRLDATNIVTPMVSIITNVSLEHTDILGNSVKSIAAEKAGIIKENIPVITAAKHTARETIEAIAKGKNAPLTIIEASQWKRVRFSGKDQEFMIRGSFKDYPVKPMLLGEFQGENLAVAIATIEQLQMMGVFISDSAIIEGITCAAHPGRMEIVSFDPLLLLDGAHNPSGFEMLKKTLSTDFSSHPLILILGVLKDKDFPQMVSILAPLANTIICTKSQNPRALDPFVLQKTIQDSGFQKTIIVKQTVSEAVEKAKTIAQTDDIICITGSLFTVGEARTYLSTSNKVKSELSMV
jgi:dihydrofolate synthase/folylpolyglutamate synthase